MAITLPYKLPRGSRSSFNSLKSGSSLIPYLPYLLSDEGRLVVAIDNDEAIELQNRGEGGVYTGKITTKASDSTEAGLNIAPGTAPASPADGDVWITTSAFLVRVGGETQRAVWRDPRGGENTTAGSTLSWSSGTDDGLSYTAQDEDLIIDSDIASPPGLRKFTFRLKATGADRTVTFTGGISNGFQPVGVEMTASGSDWNYVLKNGKEVYFECRYNPSAARWDIWNISEQDKVSGGGGASTNKIFGYSIIFGG